MGKFIASAEKIFLSQTVLSVIARIVCIDEAYANNVSDQLHI